MIALKKTICALSLGLGVIGSACAGTYSDQLAQCAIDNVTAQDKQVTVKWMFSVFAAHPDVAGMSKVTKQNMDEYDKAFADLLIRLFTKDCLTELKNVVDKEGIAAMVSTMEMVGGMLGQQVMEHPAVGARLEGYAEHLDVKELEKVLK